MGANQAPQNSGVWEESRGSYTSKVFAMNGEVVHDASQIPWIDVYQEVYYAKRTIDHSFQDDTALRHVQITRFRQCYYTEILIGLDNPDASKQISVPYTRSSRTETGQITASTETIGFDVNAEIQKTLKGANVTAGGGISGSASITYTDQTTKESTEGITPTLEIPPRTYKALIERHLVTEVQFYFSYWADTVLSEYANGFDIIEGGFGSAKSDLVDKNLSMAIFSNSIVHAEYRSDNQQIEKWVIDSSRQPDSVSPGF